MMKSSSFGRFCGVLLLAALLGGCNEKKQQVELKEQEVASVLGKTLTTKDLTKAMPFGFTEKDSVAWVKSYVKNWVEDILVADAASWDAEQQQEIDQKVEQYRHQLIVEEYEKTVVEKGFKRGITNRVIEVIQEQGKEIAVVDSTGLDLNSEAELQVQFIKHYRGDLYNKAIKSGKAAVK